MADCKESANRNGDFFPSSLKNCVFANHFLKMGQLLMSLEPPLVSRPSCPTGQRVVFLTLVERKLW